MRGIDHDRDEALLSFEGADDALAQAELSDAFEEPIQRSYSLGTRRSRNHQQGFRRRVLLAYGLRCAITGLPVQDLLEAAHIKPDHADGEASVRNGLALSRLHHAAYERNLLGIDADYTIHLAESLKRTKDGPLLKYGLVDWDKKTIRIPRFEGHQPNRDFLAERFEGFKRSEM